MYISKLYEIGFRIEFLYDSPSKKSYWGMNTHDKKILLFNVKREDYKTIEDFLLSADMQYSFLYK